jgi:threonylcarbamoyladenosine tRNA methylthiotransferase MtaB
MKFAVATFGCKVNQYESQRIREALIAQGHSEQEFTKPGADYYIINTCTVTHRSDAEGRRLMRAALRLGGRIIVTGCQSVVYPQEIKSVSDQIEILPHDKLERYFNVDLTSGIKRFEGHSRAFVKVQSGCNNFCTFCIVAYARGKPWSRSWLDIVSEINSLEQSGYKEIVLTGINIGLYEGGISLLIQKILERTSIPRIRISSIEPWTVSEKLIEMVTEEPRVCKHLHLPLQSGSDIILAKMGRPYTAAYYQDLVCMIKEASGEIAIGSDVMVGFPGEDENCFRQSRSLLEGSEITYLHVFPYSPRTKTRSAEFTDQVDAATKRKRAKELRDLSQAMRETFIRSQIGKREEIIVIKADGTSYTGITSNYLKVQVRGSASLNDLVKVYLDDYTGGNITGRPCG